MDKLNDRNLFGLFLQYFEISEIKKLIRKDKYILNFIIKHKWCISELSYSDMHWIKLGYKNIKKLHIYFFTDVKQVPKELINLRELNCIYSEIKYIPKELINLKKLYCAHTKIKEIPKTLKKLRKLSCSYTKIKEIPKTLINLKILYCSYTKIKEIPKELINLQELYCCFGTKIKVIPKELVNLKKINFKKISQFKKNEEGNILLN